MHFILHYVAAAVSASRCTRSSSRGCCLPSHGIVLHQNSCTSWLHAFGINSLLAHRSLPHHCAPTLWPGVVHVLCTQRRSFGGSCRSRGETSSSKSWINRCDRSNIGHACRLCSRQAMNSSRLRNLLSHGSAVAASVSMSARTYLRHSPIEEQNTPP